MTEFTGLDLEMAFEESYHEVVDILDGMLLHIFKGLKTKFAKEIEVIRRQFPADEFVFPEKTVRLRFEEAIKLLREAGREVDDYEDFE
jgi:aspartyl/asparaginyl-tRNA synthetase